MRAGDVEAVTPAKDRYCANIRIVLPQWSNSRLYCTPAANGRGGPMAVVEGGVSIGGDRVRLTVIW